MVSEKEFRQKVEQRRLKEDGLKGEKNCLFKMLPRENRLISKRSFDETREKGKLLQSKSFGLVFLQRDDREPSRFGFIVSTKISKKAVIRNKIKRSLREPVSADLLNINKGFDVVFLVKKKALITEKDEIRKEVTEVLDTAGLLIN